MNNKVVKIIEVIVVVAIITIIGLVGCRKNGENAIPVVEKTSDTEEKATTVREESEAEKGARENRQKQVAEAKAEALFDNPDSELTIKDGVGQIGVGSTSRKDVLIPTYIYFPEGYDAEETYPLVIMFAGFSASHDNGTGFKKTTAELNKEGIMVVQYDAPGYGGSTETNLAYTLTNLKKDAVDVLNYMTETFNIGKVGAFGYDVGGRVAMELQVDALYDFAQIELVAPFSDADEFIHACFGEKEWEKLKAEAKDAGLVKFGEQEYSLQWFLDWEEKGNNLTDSFVKAYKGRSTMVVYSTDDDVVSMKTMGTLCAKLGAAEIYVTESGHDVGVRGFDSSKSVVDTVRLQTSAFMKGLKD